MEHLQLKINREMLDPKFDGYKVSMENIYVDSKHLEQEMCSRTPTKNMVTLEHIKVFSNSTSLFHDSTNCSDDEHEFFYRVLENGQIQRLMFEKTARKWNVSIVSDINIGKEDSAFPVNLLFTERNLIVACNGVSAITVFLAASKSNWVKMLEQNIIEGTGLALIEARVFNNELHILAQSIESEPQAKTCSKIHWITVDIQDIDYAEQLQIKRKEVFVQKGHFQTCSFDGNGCIIFLSSEKPSSEYEKTSNDYTWTQDDNSVKVTFNLDSNISNPTSDEIDLNITKSEVLLMVKGTTILSGSFFGFIDENDVEVCSDPQTNSLNLIFKKSEPKKWENLTTDRKISSIISNEKVFGADETAEECDEADSSLSFFWIDQNTCRTVKQCDVAGCQVLFISRDCVSPATVCLRYDVDGILLSLKEASPRHWATLHAFGYVQASKVNRVWSGCSPNNKYACIVEGNNRVLLYSQKMDIEGTLSNRKTSTTLNHISKQHIIRIECSDPVQGVHLTNDLLFALTKNQIHVAELPK